MSVPKLTHLQFLVIGVLLRGDCSGRVVRSELEAFGIRKSGPAFYQLMARLEDAGWDNGDAADVESLIRCTRRLIEDFL